MLFIRQQKNVLLLKAFISIVVFLCIHVSTAQAVETCKEAAIRLHGAGKIDEAQCKSVCSDDDNVFIPAKSAQTDCATNASGDTICCVKFKPEGSTPSSVQAPISVASTPVFDPLKGIGLIGLLNRLITGFLSIVGALALLVFVYAGVMYMASSSSETRLKKARDTMKYGAIGLAIIIFAYTITRVYFRVLIEEPPAVPAQQAAPVAPSGS